MYIVKLNQNLKVLGYFSEINSAESSGRAIMLLTISQFLPRSGLPKKDNNESNMHLVILLMAMAT